MIILSLNYFLLLSISFVAYNLTSSNYKHLIIFLSSIFFIWNISINTLLFSLLFVGINYLGGTLIFKYKEDTHLKRMIFWSFLSINLAILIFFKYINFVIDNINTFLDIVQSSSKVDIINVILPIGISYYTFQSIGYLIRINRGFEIPENNFLTFSNFLLFFPKFLAGPIERSNHFFPQLKNPIEFDSAMVSSGLRLILFGVFKKIVIADNLSGIITDVYSNVHYFTGTPLIATIVLQLIYIYCDFSGYTDMALGSALIFGIKLIDNFNRPFLAKSITQFWKRWHISLSSWCNDFIYLPFIIRYRKFGDITALFGIFLTFTIIGIWHGANWTYLILGLLQGSAIVYEFYTKRWRIKIATFVPTWLSNFISRILVLAFMGISMVFFFSNSLSDAKYLLLNAFKNVQFNFSGYSLISNKINFYVAICSFIVLFCLEIFQEKGFDLNSHFNNQPRLIRWFIYYIVVILMFFYNSEVDSFVYLGF